VVILFEGGGLQVGHSILMRRAFACEAFRGLYPLDNYFIAVIKLTWFYVTRYILLHFYPPTAPLPHRNILCPCDHLQRRQHLPYIASDLVPEWVQGFIRLC